MLANATSATGRTATASTGRTKKGTTGRKRSGTKEGRSTDSIMEEIKKGNTAQDCEEEARTEGKLSSVYGSVTYILCLKTHLIKF